PAPPTTTRTRTGSTTRSSVPGSSCAAASSPSRPGSPGATRSSTSCRQARGPVVELVETTSEGAVMKEFRAAVEAGDFDAIGALFADDVVFRSPVAFKPYAGRPIVHAIIRGVGRVFEDFRYVNEIADGA